MDIASLSEENATLKALLEQTRAALAEHQAALAAAGRSAAEGASIRWTELAENVGLREAEPGRTRFARLETECKRSTEALLPLIC